MHFVEKRPWSAAALVVVFVLVLSNFGYATALPTVSVADVSAHDGQAVTLVFTFQNPLHSAVSFEVEGDSQRWGVCKPDGDCASVREFEFEPTVQPGSTLQKTVTLESTGFDDRDGGPWHFVFHGSYDWDSSSDQEGRGTYSADVTLTDTADAPEPGTLLLIGSGAVALAGLAMRKQENE